MSFRPPAFSNLSVGKRLIIANAIPLLLLVGFAVWLWLTLSKVETSVEVQVQQHQSLALLAQDMQREVIQVQQFLSDVSATRGQDGLDDGFKLASENKDLFIKHIQTYQEQAATLGDDVSALSTLRQKFEAYYSLGVDMAKTYVEGGPAQGNKKMGDFDAASTALQDILTPFVTTARQSSEQAIKQLSQQALTARTSSLVLVLFIALLMLVLSHLIANSITQPLRDGVRVAQSIADGDLTQAVNARGTDEIAELMSALEAMRTALRKVVSHVQTASEDVASASTQIAQGNADMSTRTEHQASALEQTAASMEELRTTVEHTAENARTASQLATQAAHVAVQGGQAVGEVVHTMHEINDASRRIADIVGLIDSIAFQTNILALNAAVEAARAGEQGRGFAVVASEVRSLAGRSATAAKEIKQLIDSSVARVDAGSAQVDKAGEIINQVIKAINEAVPLMSNINTDTAMQAREVAEASESITEMDQTTQQNSAMVEEMAAAASGLRSQAQELVRIVSVFRLESRGPASFKQG